jgi:three-Cys-motif partner protein
MPKVDLTHYLDREQAYVKHCLLEQYLPELAYRVGRNWDAIAYVDGFAGPWQTQAPDYTDSSFGVAINSLRACQTGLQETYGRHIHLQSILVEQEKKPYAELKKFAERESTANFEVHALRGDFIQNIPAIENLIRSSAHNPFQFVFLDPKGWAQIPMRHLKRFLNNRSCEVLINLMTGHIVRFLNESNRAESYNDLFGRGEVLEILKQAPQEQRTELAVEEYCRSLSLLCNFRYASAAVIFKPAEERISYYLVYGTNHPRGVEVFKTAELKAAQIQDAVRHETQIRKTGQPQLVFDKVPPGSPLSFETRQRYVKKAQDRVLDFLSSQQKKGNVLYEVVLCEAMAFPLVAPDDVVKWLEALKPDVEIQLTGTRRRRKPNPLRHDEVVVVDPLGLRQNGRAKLGKT